jgi:hypothetical protein
MRRRGRGCFILELGKKLLKKQHDLIPRRFFEVEVQSQSDCHIVGAEVWFHLIAIGKHWLRISCLTCGVFITKLGGEIAESIFEIESERLHEFATPTANGWPEG